MVHIVLEIGDDDAVIYGVLKKRLNDFDTFLRDITKNFINKSKNNAKQNET